MNSIEFCAGAGGQALGLEQAGFRHSALVEIEPDYAATLRLNRPNWDVRCADMNGFDGRPFEGIDMFAGGLPCPPFSAAGKQLGERDERNLFPAALRLIDEMRPKAIMIENVRGFLSAVFEDYRNGLKSQLEKLGYKTDWRLLNETLVDLMGENGWSGAKAWAKHANDIAPTIVGGSKKHGGPDLGPTRARAAWATLGVEGKSLFNEAPGPDFVGTPRLTVRMVARLQGFPDNWQFHGGKTTSYRQVGNAFPPPVAKAVATNLKIALSIQKHFLVRAA
jgi:DNA (cytosine-5)-methyltransferase 1